MQAPCLQWLPWCCCTLVVNWSNLGLMEMGESIAQLMLKIKPSSCQIVLRATKLKSPASQRCYVIGKGGRSFSPSQLIIRLSFIWAQKLDLRSWANSSLWTWFFWRMFMTSKSNTFVAQLCFWCNSTWSFLKSVLEISFQIFRGSLPAMLLRSSHWPILSPKTEFIFLKDEHFSTISTIVGVRTCVSVIIVQVMEVVSQIGYFCQPWDPWSHQPRHASSQKYIFWFKFLVLKQLMQSSFLKSASRLQSERSTVPF